MADRVGENSHKEVYFNEICFFYQKEKFTQGCYMFNYTQENTLIYQIGNNIVLLVFMSLLLSYSSCSHTNFLHKPTPRIKNINLPDKIHILIEKETGCKARI